MKLHNRVVKAGFWTDTDLLKINRDIRTFYQGLWQLADDSGCIENDPFAFKIHLYPSPLDADITIDVLEDWITSLIDLGKLIPYVSDGKKCLYIKNFHKHQTLRSPAPPETPLPEWIKWVPSEKSRRSGEYIVKNPYGDRTVTVENPNGDQPEPEPEIEPEEEKEDILSTASPKTTVTPYDDIVSLYHNFCPSLPRIVKLTPKRKKSINARFRASPDLEVFKKLFSKAEASDFLSGRNGKWTSCNFDWLLNENNMLKVLEGSYDNRAPDNNYRQNQNFNKNKRDLSYLVE